MQEVVLDKNIRLIDSPGVVFDDEDGEQGAGAVLRNSIDADCISDPIPAIEELLNRATMESIMMTYNVPAFPKGDVMTFLAMAARSKGKVLKGGIPDKIMAARMVLKDWNKGKIPYYSVPPVQSSMDMDGAATSEAKIVSHYSEEFDVNKILLAHDAELMEGLEEKDEMDFVQVNSASIDNGKRASKVLSYLTNEQDDDEEGDGSDSDEDMDDDDNDEIAANNRMEDAEDFDFDG
jgi:nuclear GTP-binding protein